MKRLLVLCFLVSIVCVTACDDSGNKYTVNMIHSGVTDGIKGYAKFVAFDDGAGCDGTALYFVEATFSSGSAVATVKNIAAGSYRGCIFIDNNDSASGANTSMPDGGDYSIDSGGEDAIVVPDSKSATINEDEWSTVTDK